MANTVSLSTTVNTDNTATIVDGTTFSSPLRTACGVFVKVFKVDALAVQTTLTVTSDDSDPETDSSWTFDIDTDGWYQAYYVSIPDFNAASTYAIYEAVFNPTDNKVYRSLQNSNTEDTLTNLTWWEEITDPATLAANDGGINESTNIDSAVYNEIILNQVEEIFGDAALLAASDVNGVEPNEVSQNDLRFAFIDSQREAALIAELRQQYAAAERYVRRLDEFLA